MQQKRLRTKAISMLLVWFLVCVVFVGMIVILNEFADEAEAITVPVDYPSIQSAVENATDGVTIHVWAGTYYENIVVDKTVTLIGNGTANTTIDGGGVGDVVKVTADWVNITGFTITNSGGEKQDAGIVLDKVQKCNITDNLLSNNNFGVYLPPSGLIQITNNIFNGNLSPFRHGSTEKFS